MKTSMESFFDYSSRGFIMPLTVEGMNMYACINDDAQETPAPYYVYLQHPKKGTCAFKIKHDMNGHSFSEDAPAFINKQLIREIDMEIAGQKE